MKCVRDVMTTNLATLTPEDNVYEAALMMKEQDIGVVPVCEGERLLGVVTDRDLVIRGLAEKHPGSYAITNVLSEDVVTIGADMNIVEAADIMADEQIRRLPVVDGQKLVGMLSLGDLALDSQSNQAAEVALSNISEHQNLHH